MKTATIKLIKGDKVKHHYVNDHFGNVMHQAIYLGPKPLGPRGGMSGGPVDARDALHLSNPHVGEVIERKLRTLIRKKYTGLLSVEYGTQKGRIIVKLTPINDPQA
jgi:hypothetical protein